MNEGSRGDITKKSLSPGLRNGFNATFVTALAIALLVIFLAPFLFMIFTSLKTQGQISQLGAPIWPAKPTAFEYNGKNLDMFMVPMSTCAGADPNDASAKAWPLLRKAARKASSLTPPISP